MVLTLSSDDIVWVLRFSLAGSPPSCQLLNSIFFPSVTVGQMFHPLQACISKWMWYVSFERKLAQKHQHNLASLLYLRTPNSPCSVYHEDLALLSFFCPPLCLPCSSEFFLYLQAGSHYKHSQQLYYCINYNYK